MRGASSLPRGNISYILASPNSAARWHATHTHRDTLTLSFSTLVSSYLFELKGSREIECRRRCGCVCPDQTKLRGAAGDLCGADPTYTRTQPPVWFQSPSKAISDRDVIDGAIGDGPSEKRFQTNFPRGNEGICIAETGCAFVDTMMYTPGRSWSILVRVLTKFAFR